MARARRGRGEGALFWDKQAGVWAAEISLGYDAEGKRIRRRIRGRKGETKAQVRQRLAELIQDIATGAPVKPEKLTVAEHFQDWLRAKRPNVRETTYHAYEVKIRNHIIKHLGHIKLTDLTYRHVEAMYEQMDTAGLSPRMVHDVAALLRQGLDDAVKKGLIKHNPAKLAAKRTFPDKEARFMTAEEIRLFRAGCEGERLGNLFIFMLETGVRLGEALGLPWSAVDFEAGKVTIRQALHEVRGRFYIGDVKTAAGRRTITLTTAALQVLRDQKRAQTEARLKAGPAWNNEWDLVFTGENGAPLRRSNITRRDLHRVIQNARRIELERLVNAGVPIGKARDQVAKLLERVTPHSLRHTHASLLIFSGADPQVVRRRLGHANIVVTLQKYGHLFPNQDEMATARLEEFLATL